MDTVHSSQSTEYEESPVLSSVSHAQLQLKAALENAELARSESIRLRMEFELERSIEKNTGSQTTSPASPPRIKVLQDDSETTLLRTACRNQETEIKILKEIEAVFRGRCTVQSEELKRVSIALRDQKLEFAEAQRRSSTLEESLQECQQQVIMLRQLLNSQESRNKIEEKALERKAVQLERQEEQLRVYATSLSNTRNEVKEFSKELVSDIEATRTLHPLNDYLALTEFELSKIELQLKKTPTVSSDRPKLETCLEQLMTQRNFLRSTIDSSHKENEKRASIILKIAESSNLPYIPPPPPHVVRVERARTQGLEET